MKTAIRAHQFIGPVKNAETPQWASLVDRWYQLDVAAYTLAEAYWRMRADFSVRPGWIFLASPGASNWTDADFAAAAVASPAKFVHTLPNIRGASLLKLMDWSGPVFCVQKDPATLLCALTEGIRLWQSTKTPLWVATARPSAAGPWCAEIYEIGPEGPYSVQMATSAPDLTQDSHWHEWRENSDGKFVAEEFEIFKK